MRNTVIIFAKKTAKKNALFTSVYLLVKYNIAQRTHSLDVDKKYELFTKCVCVDKKFQWFTESHKTIPSITHRIY